MFIYIANLFAKFSCPMWCRIRVIRGFCRRVYRWMAENPKSYAKAMQKRGMSEAQLAHLAYLPFSIDTYPPLYADRRFAPWEEVADPENPRKYNLISSSGDQVIRRSPSYCDWKIFELTGQHLSRNLPGRFDAANWVKYLAQAGYQTVVDQPLAGCHYVGVIPGYGEFGQAVWFGGIDQSKNYNCSTYEDFQFKTLQIQPDDRRVIWVQID